MKRNYVICSHMFFENQQLKQDLFDMKAKLNAMETNHKLLMENEMMYINKILLLENKLISLKKKLKIKQPPKKEKDNEPIFYLSTMHTSHDEMSDVSTLTISEIN